MAWSLVEVYGTWGPDDDHRGEGRWVATLPDRLTTTADTKVLQAGEYRSGKLDPRGSKKSLSFMAPAIDDPTVTPAMWGPLDLLVLFQDGSTERYAVSAPYAARPVADGGTGAGLNLKTLDPVTSAPGPTLYPRSYVGTGSPEGSVAAEPGSYYTDTDGSDANWLWVKTSGSGDTGWEPSIGTSSPAVLGGGGDAQLTTGATDILVSPDVEWKLSEPLGLRPRQITSQKAIGGSGSPATDELAPFQWRDGSVAEWRAGNHGTLCWDATTGVVSVADIGTTWTDGGGNYITLLHYDATGGVATWSKRHNAAGTTLNATAPTGTWTASGKPNIDFTALAPTYAQHTRWDERTTVQGPWRPGRNPLTRITLRQVCPSQVTLIAHAKANPGVVMGSGDVPPGFTLQTITEWRGHAPNIAYVAASVTLHEAAAISQWSGLQASKWGTICMPGTTGTVYSSGLVAGVGAYTYAYPANWVDGEPPTAMLSADAVHGGVAVGVLASPQDRSTLAVAEQVSGADKMYPIAVGGATVYPAGTVLTVRGFRSITTSATTAQFHIVPDPETDTVYWWAAASAAGTAANQLASDYLGYDLVVDRTSGITVGKLTPDGVSLSGAGWAEGRLTKPSGVTPVRPDVLYGTGSPEGVVTAEVGTEYRDTTGAFGAWVWLKKTGSGNTGWKVTQGDTGWRDVAYVNGWVGVGAGGQIRRTGQRVRFRMRYRCDATAATATTFYIPPAGFTVPAPSGRSVILGWLNAQSRAGGSSMTQGIPYAIDSGTDGGLRCALPGASTCTAIAEWETEDDPWLTAWPT